MNTIETLSINATVQQENLNIQQIHQIIEEHAPETLNTILIDEKVAPARYEYCYLNAFAQRVVYRTEQRSCASNDLLEIQIKNLVADGTPNPYVKMPDDSLVNLVEKSPKFNLDGVLGNAKKRLTDLVNGSEKIEHKHLILNTEQDKLTEQQPLFLIKNICRIQNCPQCNGLMYMEEANSEGQITRMECSACKGLGHVSTVAWLVPKTSNKQVSFIYPNGDSIENLKNAILEKHIGTDTTPVLMAVHLNGTDKEQYPETLKPYLDALHDQIGENNAIEHIYYRIIPCFTFQYRNVLTNQTRTGVLVDPFGEPEVVLELVSTSAKIATGLKDTAKNLSKLFGGIGKSKSAKGRADLLHSIRLMIAIVVADGDVCEEEKKSLILTMQGIDTFSSSEQQQLLSLLASKDSSFLTDEDFHFNDPQVGKTTLLRLQEIAEASGDVSIEEREIIEKLRLSI